MAYGDAAATVSDVRLAAAKSAPHADVGRSDFEPASAATRDDRYTSFRDVTMEQPGAAIIPYVVPQRVGLAFGRNDRH